MMSNIIEFIKALIYGIVEGITEWLPISSTGHLILLEEYLPMKVSEAFFEMFMVVIQLGACLAVLTVFAKKLLPKFGKAIGEGGFLHCDENKRTFSLWAKIILAVIPSAVIGLLFDDWFDEHFYNATVVSITLALYGLLYIIVEKARRKEPTATDIHSVTYLQAFGMGCFQILALIPGTSRSGSTILGGLLLGFSRTSAAEMSFFLALPTMVGASGLKVLKFILDGSKISSTELIILAIGCVVAYAVSMVAIRFLTDFVKKHTFIPFGIYRIILAAVIILLMYIGV